eukprot:3405845-Rhodomonas_salina.1
MSVSASHQHIPVHISHPVGLDLPQSTSMMLRASNPNRNPKRCQRYANLPIILSVFPYVSLGLACYALRDVQY